MDRGIERRCAPAADHVGVDDALELVGGGARGLDVPGSERDLDLSRELLHPTERLFDLLEASPDARDSGVDLALGEAEQGQPGLRDLSPLVRLAVRRVGGGEVATTPTDLADLVVPRGRHEAVVVVKLLACRDRLCLGLRPVAAESHDLRAVDAALPGWTADVETVAPAVRRVGPFPRAAVVAKLLARRDRAAVDETGRRRVELAGHGGRGRFVEELEALVDLAGIHRELALPGERHSLEVAVAEALTQLECVLEVCRGALDIGPHQQRRESAEERPVCMLD